MKMVISLFFFQLLNVCIVLILQLTLIELYGRVFCFEHKLRYDNMFSVSGLFKCNVTFVIRSN